jgi:hypothetical protein
MLADLFAKKKAHKQWNREARCCETSEFYRPPQAGATCTRTLLQEWRKRQGSRGRGRGHLTRRGGCRPLRRPRRGGVARRRGPCARLSAAARRSSQACDPAHPSRPSRPSHRSSSRWESSRPSRPSRPSQPFREPRCGPGGPLSRLVRRDVPAADKLSATTRPHSNRRDACAHGHERGWAGDVTARERGHARE